MARVRRKQSTRGTVFNLELLELQESRNITLVDMKHEMKPDVFRRLPPETQVSRLNQATVIGFWRNGHWEGLFSRESVTSDVWGVGWNMVTTPTYNGIQKAIAVAMDNCAKAGI